jgi:hypothetical protein
MCETKLSGECDRLRNLGAQDRFPVEGQKWDD